MGEEALAESCSSRLSSAAPCSTTHPGFGDKRAAGPKTCRNSSRKCVDAVASWTTFMTPRHPCRSVAHHRARGPNGIPAGIYWRCDQHLLKRLLGGGGLDLVGSRPQELLARGRRQMVHC